MQEIHWDGVKICSMVLCRFMIKNDKLGIRLPQIFSLILLRRILYSLNIAKEIGEKSFIRPLDLFLVFFQQLFRRKIFPKILQTTVLNLELNRVLFGQFFPIHAPNKWIQVESIAPEKIKKPLFFFTLSLHSYILSGIYRLDKITFSSLF